MDWLKPQRKENRIRFLAMMESGQLVDEEAEIVQTQVIAHKARASIRNRDAVPLYHQTEEDRPPVWEQNLLIETGLSPPPGMDSRYVLEDAPSLFMGIRLGAVTMDDGLGKLKSNSVAITSVAASVVVFLGCAWLAGLGQGSDSPPATAKVPPPAVSSPAAVSPIASPIVPIQPTAVPAEFRHGFVDELEEPPREEEDGGESDAQGEGDSADGNDPDA